MVARTKFPESDHRLGARAQGKRGKAARPKDELWATLRLAWRALGKRLPEMRADLSCYATVQVDRARLAASQLGTRVVCGILLIIAVSAVFAIASSLVIHGTAGGVAAALGGNIWLANLITGAAALVALFSAITIGARVRSNKRRRRLERRYRRHDARQQAMDAAPPREQPC